MQAIAYIQIRKVATATISPMGESPCSSAVSIQSSSLRIDLLLHFADKVLGVLNEKLCVGSIATDLYAAVFVRESHASVRSPLGTERAAQCVHFEIRVCLQQSNSLAEILKGNVMQPCSESGDAAADAHVLTCEAAALEIDALRDLDFVLVVNWFEFHFFSPHHGTCTRFAYAFGDACFQARQYTQALIAFACKAILALAKNNCKRHLLF